MSWQTYLDERLMCDIDEPDHHLTAAAILSHDGSVLAQSRAFPQLIPEEVQDIMAEFNEPGHLATEATGLSLGGNKYHVIQGEPQLVIRALKGAEADQTSHQNHMSGHGGVCIMKTKQSLIFGFYDHPVAAAQCSVLVEGLGECLLSEGL
ncbi:hypothetical protein RND81_07G092100 [Saponaria officinalis]|uniref:Profilin n=1 Tax=Saponaria officinalis TaxID=3572 RepID=A0AAW1JQM2_SAPOF